MHNTLQPEPGLTVRTARNGRGIFATKHFTPGKVIYQIQGTRYYYMTLWNRGGTFLDNCFRLSPEYYLSPEGHIGVFLNHSCEPNARVEKRGNKLFVIALSLISPVTEVLIDYSTITASDDIWTMRCNCGAKSCRKVVRNWTKLPRATKEHYKATRILPRYIEKL